VRTSKRPQELEGWEWVGVVDSKCSCDVPRRVWFQKVKEGTCLKCTSSASPWYARFLAARAACKHTDYGAGTDAANAVNANA